MDRTRSRLAQALRLTVVAVSTAFLVYFVVWPIGAVLQRGLWTGGSFRADALSDVVRSARNRRIVTFTLWQATISTLGSLAIGLPLTYVLERRRPRGAAFVRALVLVPFALPTVVVGAAFVAIFGSNGPLRSWEITQSLTIIVIAHVYFNVAVVVRVVGPRWRLLDERPGMAARVLGATRWQRWKATTIPALGGVFLNATAVVWMFCVTSFGVIATLGGPRNATVETEIYRLTTQELALDRASGLVIAQLVVVVGTLLVVQTSARRSEIIKLRHGELFVRQSPRTIAIDIAMMVSAVAFVVTPLVFVVQGALRDDRLGLRMLGRRSRFGWRPIDSVRQSVQFAAWATLLTLILGVGIAFALSKKWTGARVLGPLSALPLGVSAVTLGFGFLIALDAPFDLRSRWQLVPVAHALVALPIVLRTVLPVFEGIAPSTREAATMLGASPVSVIRHIDIAIARRAIGTAAAFAAAISFGEFGATSFIARTDTPTMPIAIAKLLSMPGASNRATAYGLSVVLIVVVGVVIAIAGIQRPRRLEVFR